MTSYKTNRRSKNWSMEERLERALDTLEGRVEFFEPDEDNSAFVHGNVADAQNLDDIYRRVGECIKTLQRFQTWLNLPNC
jgi:hypothetical protein